MPLHDINDCPQTPTLSQIQDTLKRLDAHGERTAVALESIAAQGAILGSHEKRLDKHDLDLREVFNRVNDEHKLTDLTVAVRGVAARVEALELAQAKEEGVEETEARIEAQQEAVALVDKKFWTDLKLKLLNPIIFSVFFLAWLVEKYGLATKLKALLKEFKG